MRNIIGSPAKGENFFDRRREQARIWERLETDNLLLLAPRRVGKTSLLYRLADTAREHGFRALHVNVARTRSEDDLIDALLDALAQHDDGQKLAAALRKKGPIAGWSERVRAVQAMGVGVTLSDAPNTGWRSAADALVEGLHQSKSHRWLVMLDELPLFVTRLLADDRERARLFLDWMRAVRIDRRLGDRTRWIVCGSIGLDTVTARARLGDAINDLAHMPLGAFAERDAITFLRLLGNAYDLPLEPEDCTTICQRIGWPIPFHLQLMFSALRDLCAETGRSASIEVIDQAYALLLEPSHRSYFDTWIQRLPDELGPVEGPLAMRVLNAVASDPEGMRASTLDLRLAEQLPDDARRRTRLRYVLDVLQNDGYLVDDRGRLRFRSNLLRDYWRARVMP